MAGEIGPTSVSPFIAMVIAGFFAISCSNVIEIFVLIFDTFKRRTGLYFWSILVASLASHFPICVIAVTCWYTIITGQVVVLYSRLHLVTMHALKPVFEIKSPNKRKGIQQLILINILIILLNISFLITDSKWSSISSINYSPFSKAATVPIVLGTLVVLEATYHPGGSGILQSYSHCADYSVGADPGRLDPSKVELEEASKGNVKTAHIEAHSHTVKSQSVESDQTVQQRAPQQKVRCRQEENAFSGQTYHIREILIPSLALRQLYHCPHRNTQIMAITRTRRRTAQRPWAGREVTVSTPPNRVRQKVGISTPILSSRKSRNEGRCRRSGHVLSFGISRIA
ncbi:hypothetical protein DL95DRAFT_418688 [Leptodontidium sp. 2 PMI_412]|nr:hypothetical protein DL95DRAFT_418688 [Leptodontidium sp. 2 PMI_412]